MGQRSLRLRQVGLSVLWLWAASALAGTTDAESKTVEAPDFGAVSLDTAEQRRLSEFAGDVVLLNFWASWCFPCRYEMPHFQEIYDELRDVGVTVVAVAVYDKIEDARAFQEKYEFSFPLLFDTNNEATEAFDVKVVPQTFLIGRDGRLVAIPNPKTGASKYRVNDPTIWENAQTIEFLRTLAQQ